MKLTNKHTVTFSAFTLGAAVLSGCLFSGDPVTTTKPDEPIKVTACTDLAPAQQKTADSLVVLATAKMTADMEYMFSDTVSDWESAKARSPQAALKLYDQALAVAPGHCGATFGRAVASTMMLTQDPKLDAFVAKAEAANNAGNSPDMTGIPKVGTGRGLMKLSPTQAAPALLKLSSEMNALDFPTVTEFQTMAEAAIMPKLDSTIASLEQALAFANFSFEFTTQDGQTVQLDQGDIGPLLAGLKVAKAWLTIALGYQWELSINGNYHWMDTIGDIRNADLDHLRPGQTAALNQLTGFFKTGSSFSKIRPAWKTKVNGIPNLLLEAVNDAQKGLRYSISEADKPTGQELDLYVVGSGPDADVDPADLQRAVDLLEHAKKYLTGEVPLSYNKGTRTLKANFAKLFEIDGIQSKLPYFEFYPYAEWNDTISADTTWYSEMYGDASNELLGKLGYNHDEDYMVSVSKIGFTYDSIAVSVYEPAKDTIINGMTYSLSGNTRLAVLARSPDAPCTYTYKKSFDRERITGAPVVDPNDPFAYTSPYKSVANAKVGEITLSLCRETADGIEYVEYMDVKTKGPIYFTNPTGGLTIDILDLDKYSDDLPALENKIYFRDPTFGGVFPELTQANIWGYINSLKTISPSTKQVCDDVLTPDGFYSYECRVVKVSDPSDLDLLLEAVYMMDGAF